ncbi:uncharacterized protein LOC142901658 isoform X1 [Nelusetta ayraudi]|uniref:uncharacterized protein LOC142901658 isoform X1 n=1 Tax=Nelusetta ayraudi TaxID=303726 RepID=UPI003F6E7B08
MADDMEHQVSSTTSLFTDEVHHYQAEPEPEAEPPQPDRDLFSMDEIVDLVGGAQDALNRHMAEDDSPQEFTQVLDSHPEDLVTWAEPEPVPEEQPGLPDSTSPPLVPVPVLVPSPVAEEPKVIAPTAEPESTRIESEPRVEPAPEPSPENDALPAAADRRAAAAAPAEESERPTVTEEAPAAPASYAPSPSKAQPPLLMQFPTEHWDSPYLSSQETAKVSMDPFSKDTPPLSSGFAAPDLRGNHSDDDDDLMYDVKKDNNSFDGFSPLADSGYSHFGESKMESKAPVMSESPTPDLVQYGQTEAQETPPSFLGEGKHVETGRMAAEPYLKSANQFSAGFKDEEDEEELEEEEEEEEDSALPPSLPDILKSSPLNPDKIDSGSSEGSPEEQSPILERKMMESPNPPINLSANNPFALDAKVSLLKEMTEEMEVRVADKGKTEEEEKSFGAFDLVKEVEETAPTKAKEEEPVKIEEKDWFSSRDPPKMMDRFQPLDFQAQKTPAEDSDSESPTADSLSPVLEAMAKNPASFQVETEKKGPAAVEEAEVAEEVSEHEVSSEEFEFIERPPKGVIDEFLEALDTSKFATSKPPEIPLDDELTFDPKYVPAGYPAQPPQPEAKEESSYHLLTSSTTTTTTSTSQQKSKAGLEILDIQQAPPTVSSVSQPDETVAQKQMFKMPRLNIRAVVDLLYWRDVKTTGVVFGAALLLLLSLMACSIISVCSYIGLALLSVTICFRIYKGILQAIQKSDEGHPFKQYLDQEVALSEDMVHKYSDLALAKFNKGVGELRRLFLVDDLVDSIKFAVFMWILTYVGALFNGLTLLILGLIAVFSCPIIYEKHQVQIDHYVALVNNQLKDIVAKCQASIPGMKRKAE